MRRSPSQFGLSEVSRSKSYSKNRNSHDSSSLFKPSKSSLELLFEQHTTTKDLLIKYLKNINRHEENKVRQAKDELDQVKEQLEGSIELINTCLNSRLQPLKNLTADICYWYGITLLMINIKNSVFVNCAYQAISIAINHGHEDKGKLLPQLKQLKAIRNGNNTAREKTSEVYVLERKWRKTLNDKATFETLEVLEPCLEQSLEAIASSAASSSDTTIKFAVFLHENSMTDNKRLSTSSF